MQDIKIYKQKDLVLSINQNYNPANLKLGDWQLFIDRLCDRRDYQKRAIENAIIYLASKRYKKIEDLIEENYQENIELQGKYTTCSGYKNSLQISNKLFANIDLATGTGKSYVIYGIAQIMLGLGLVDKVLVLCPSLTIEAGLIEKFVALSSDTRLRESIPNSAIYKNPRIVDANVTIKNGDICVENIHAVYENTSSSIEDSLKKNGKRVLVLNDESHHIFNKLQSVSGSSTEGKSIKKWKAFLLNSEYSFKYILGFTGTAYNENEYFNDVIYRYSLREAIEDRIVKNIEYVQKDDSSGIKEKFQKIYLNHQYNINNYSKIKPLTILITKDIIKAKNLKDDLVEFLSTKEQIPKEIVEDKVLVVTSSNEHKLNLPKLKLVDDKDSPIEWIVSVSMLTEGWDVKNVFQIIPWEDRAFNSKLLIAQVLGRGLRIPEEYNIPQPKVIVFNHDSWSKNIRKLIDEVLEIETRVYSNILNKGNRAKYNFEVYNLNYKKNEVEVEHKKDKEIINYSRIEKEGIKLESQVIEAVKETSYESILGFDSRAENYIIEYRTWEVDKIVDKIYDEFESRDWEGKILQLGESEYLQESLPPREKIENIIKKSMNKVGINGDLVVEKNVNRILQAFSTMLRKKSKTVISKNKIDNLIIVKTNEMYKTSSGIGNLRRGFTVFYTNNYNKEIVEEHQLDIINQLILDESLPRSATKEINEFLFKTPLDLVISSSNPEKNFIDYLNKPEYSNLIESWVKSRDKGFYSIEYSMRYGSSDSKTRKYSIKTFNPDFFIKSIKDGIEYLFVVEIKDDKDDSDENKAKYKYAVEHFNNLNNELKKASINQKYLFHFLSPNGYIGFFQYLKNGTLFESQDRFRCELENLLEE